MGVVEKVTCTACKQEWECRTGCGLLHGSLKNVAKLFEEPVAAEIRAHQEMEPFPVYDFGYQLGNCTKCYDVVSVPVLKMRKSQKEYIGTCPKCGEMVNLIEDIKHTPCVICGKTALQSENVGHWD